jgi:hypothetical protein
VPDQKRSFAFLASSGETAYVYLSALPKGSYTLQFDVAWQNPLKPARVEVSVVQGVEHPFNTLVVLLLVGLVPLLVGLYQIYFEMRRWKDSNTAD